ncbi:hypothetical protein PQX77_006686 [Marasmius sp. AFHP31]|nr:hypothetical protein PQX77_006686 [Marasmius sp. AFHP31]
MFDPYQEIVNNCASGTPPQRITVIDVYQRFSHHNHHLATLGNPPVFPVSFRFVLNSCLAINLVGGKSFCGTDNIVNDPARIMCMRDTHPGWGTHNSNREAYGNIIYGQGQNVNYGQDLNISYGRDQNNYNWGGQLGHMYGGEVKNAGRDFINNSYTTNDNSFERLVSITTGIGASHKAEHQFERGDRPSFFFFRSDPKRNNPRALIPTIAHDLASTTPLMLNHIKQRISEDPRILEATLEAQFRELILELVLAWSRKRSLWGFFTDLPGSPVVSNIVVIDGLDECGDEQIQMCILSIIQSTYQQAPYFPLRFLTCSRSELWLQEASADKPLFQLSKRIVLDDSLAAHEDIRRYYCHHFREIVAYRRYGQVGFPTPWPSEADLEILVERACGQFIFAATVIKTIGDAFRRPIEQLRIIIQNIPLRRPVSSPYQLLDVLYDFILRVNPDYDEVRAILAAILVLPTRSMRTPVCIELLIGLPTGQVAATLRGMHSVLDIRGSSDEIRVFHISFRDYLVDQTRSGCFHINVDTQKNAIARQWLQNLTTSQPFLRVYSPSRLYSDETRPFFTEWSGFCQSLPPTENLLDDLRNVDLASSYVAALLLDWHECYAFKGLASWVQEYHDPEISQDENQAGDRGSTGKNTCAKANGYPSYVKGQRAVEGHSRAMGKRDKPASVERLAHRLQNHPGGFHLEWPSGVSLQDGVVYWLIDRATRCPEPTQLDGPPPRGVDDVRLTECHRDLSEGIGSRDPGHLLYQEACIQL